VAEVAQSKRKKPTEICGQVVQGGFALSAM